jgi:hypothetical protein
MWSLKCQTGVRSTFDKARNVPEEEEEVAEHKATFLDALKGLEAARKYICQFDTEKYNIVMWNKVENELCGLRAQVEKKNR